MRAKSAARKEAQEMVDKAKKLSNESVVVGAPKEAREEVAAARSTSAASSSSKGWEPSLPSSRKVAINDPPLSSASDETMRDVREGEVQTVAESNW
eukprot:9272913-Karenia_brevis.AAC.1